jgi:hypothetical protein
MSTQHANRFITTILTCSKDRRFPDAYRRGSQVHRREFGFDLGRSFGCVLGRGEADRLAQKQEPPPVLAGGGSHGTMQPLYGKFSKTGWRVMMENVA